MPGFFFLAWGPENSLETLSFCTAFYIVSHTFLFVSISWKTSVLKTVVRHILFIILVVPGSRVSLVSITLT